jgi:hypothetical protein
MFGHHNAKETGNQCVASQCVASVPRRFRAGAEYIALDELSESMELSYLHIGQLVDALGGQTPAQKSAVHGPRAEELKSSTGQLDVFEASPEKALNQDIPAGLDGRACALSGPVDVERL